MDAEGTGSIIEFFGDIIFEYGLNQAIAEGRLCRYRYHPVSVTLNDDETHEYCELTEKLARIIASSNADTEIKQAAMHLLIKRARLLGAAANKIPVLDRLIASLPEKPTKAIFYCGDGRTTDTISRGERRQIEAVAHMLGENHGLRVRNFTYQENSTEREAILQDLSSGFLDGIVAIRCLDEGIDLPDLRNGFLLASSTNPRQFIQRRGRLLRKAPGKNFAEIYDLIIEPPELGETSEDAVFNMERSIFAKELKRIIEFCRTADNGPEALEQVHDLCLKYNLLAF
jgi:superfamily II DNA or RNA helicase